MRRIVVGIVLGVGATVLGLPGALAQSGVVSGPPQVLKGPNMGPNAGPNTGPNNNFGSPPVEPEMRGGGGGTWIAVAGGFDGKGKHVGVGFSGQRYSRMDAESAAISACNGRGRGIQCRQAFAVPNGCIYIVPGSGGRGVTWGRGATPEVALQECRRDGYTCDSRKVIGGCLPGYSN
jgi:hypothetical protein